MRRLYFTIIMIIFIQGCASIRGRNQTMRLACESAHCEVRDSNNHYLGNAPSLIEVPRQKRHELIFSEGAKKSSITLEGRYRWLDSFAANYMLSLLGSSYFALLGIAIDLTTGSAWQYDPVPTVNISGSSNNYSFFPNDARLVIAPPQGNSELMSDAIGHHLEKTIRTKYPLFEVVPFDETLPTFQRYNYTYDHPFDSEQMQIHILQKFPATHWVESQVSKEHNEIVAETTVTDVYRSEHKQTHVYRWPNSEVKNSELLSDRVLTTKLIELLPNSLGLASSSAFGSGSALETASAQSSSLYYLEYIPNSDLIAGRLGITATNIRPDYEDRFQYLFRWTTDVHFYRSYFRVLHTNYVANQASAIDDLGTLGIYNFGFGIGPELGMAGQFGYIYWNMIPTIGTYFLDYFHKRSNEFIGNSEFTLNLGYLKEIRHQWYLRFNVGAQTAVKNNISYVIEQYTNNKVNNAYLSQSRVSLSLEYYLPQWRNWLKSKSLNWLSNSQ